MVNERSPANRNSSTPRRTTACAIVVVIAVVMWSGSRPALAQTDTAKSSAPSRLNWLPYQPGSAARGPQEEAGARNTVQGDVFSRSKSRSSVVRADGVLAGASGVEQTAFQAPLEEEGQPRPQMPQASEEFEEASSLVADDCSCDDGGLADCGPACYRRRWCRPFEPCSSSLARRLWVRGEYLLWWTEGASLPSLVTTSSAGTSADRAGVLGQPGTSVLFGDSSENTNIHSGGRITLGYWFTDCHTVGVEASFLGIGQESTEFIADSESAPIIARPYFDTQTGSQAAMLVAFPDLLRGSIQVEAVNEFQAIEVLLRRNMFRRRCDRLDFLVGWRYAQLDESLAVRQSSEWIGRQGFIIPGTTKSLVDQFDAQNEFNGAQFGLAYQEQVGRVSLETRVKIGLGNTNSRVRIAGNTVTTVPGMASVPFDGGLLAQTTNIGTYEENEFTVIPEVGVTLGCDLSDHLRATFGYTLLYWNRVARAGNQIDTNVSQLPPESATGTRQPAFSYSSSDFWAQGFNFGLEVRF